MKLVVSVYRGGYLAEASCSQLLSITAVKISLISSALAGMADFNHKT